MRETGFTLIELMIALVIVGVLAAIAYPAYTGYVQDARRADGKAGLMAAAQRLERCYTRLNAYENCIAFPQLSPDGHYSIGVAPVAGGLLTATEYKLIAVPRGVQAGDACGSLSLTQVGVRGSTEGGDDCW